MKEGTKQKISKNIKELWNDPTYRKKMVESHKDKKQSSITIEKRVQTNSGFQHSDESKKKMSDQRKVWWDECKKDTERYSKVVKNISKNNPQNCKGKFGPDHPGWRGGRWVDKRDGKVHVYIQPGHPSYGKSKRKHMYEHRYMMEEKLGRRLSKNEEVHHKNGIKDDNRDENFELVVKKQHFGKAKCPHCGYMFKVK